MLGAILFSGSIALAAPSQGEAPKSLAQLTTDSLLAMTREESTLPPHMREKRKLNAMYPGLEKFNWSDVEGILHKGAKVSLKCGQSSGKIENVV